MNERSDQQMREFIKMWMQQRAAESYERFYLQETPEEQRIYREILDTYLHMKASQRVSSTDWHKICRINRYVQQDHPELFYMDINQGFVHDDHTEVEFQLTEPLAEIDRTIRKMDTALTKLRGYTNKMSDFEKELFVHHVIVREVDYLKKEDLPIYDAHSVFLHKAAVCAGISNTVALMLNYIGVKAFTVRGFTQGYGDEKPGRHRWNMVQIHGGFYHLDVTFDNTLSGHSAEEVLDYVNLTDEAIRRDHTPLDDQVFPAATRPMDYYSLKNLIFTPHSQQLTDFIIKTSREEPDYFSFKVNRRLTHELMDEIAPDIWDALRRANELQNYYIRRFNADQDTVTLMKESLRPPKEDKK